MKQAYILLGALLAFSACTEDAVINNIESDVLNNELKYSIEQDSMCLLPEEAKYYAALELQEGASSLLSIDEYTLSDNVRIIFGYDSRPKYYEFDVLSKGEIVATITTFAQKEEEACIAFVFNTPLKRESPNNLVMFEGLYPTVYWGELGNYGEPPLALYSDDGITRIVDIPSIYEDERYEEIVQHMDAESAIQTRSILVNYKQKRQEHTTIVKQYWNYKCTTRSNSIHTKDNGVNAHDIVSETPPNSYVIPEFNKSSMLNTRWSGPCGPGVVAWVYRGLYSHYPKTGTTSDTYIRIHGDSAKYAIINGKSQQIFGVDVTNKHSLYYYNDDNCYQIYNKVADNVSRQIDNGLYEVLLDHTVKTDSNYPMYQAGLNNAIQEITNNTYCITTTTKTRDHILNNHLPVFIMLGTGKSFHYIVAFGTSKVGTQKYIYITDNGYFTSTNNYDPYWRYEGSNYGIRYKLKTK
ncbi:MAG: hypothetical protein ACI30H_09105 [Paludibacteraceae bacterium]